jgi:hypothetical protein
MTVQNLDTTPKLFHQILQITVQNLDTTPKFFHQILQRTVQNQDTIIETAPIEVWAGASYEKGGSRKRIFDSSPGTEADTDLVNGRVVFMKI